MNIDIRTDDCRTLLAAMGDKTVHCCVTSPPYFGLRDYGVDGQIGLEQTPDEYVAEMVGVFREVKRVLRDDGTLWLNLGDSYAANRTYQVEQTKAGPKHGVAQAVEGRGQRAADYGLKPKDLIGIPWQVAFALQSDGWYLRQDIIWHKPNPMPESVKDRCTKAHEYIFLFSKESRYHFDADAIKEDSCKGYAGSSFTTGKTADHQRGRSQSGERTQTRRAMELAEQHGLTDAHISAIRACGATDAGKAQTTQDGFGKNKPEVIALAAEAKAVLGGYYREFLIAEKRNRRSVWTVSTKPFKSAHFATFPPDLIEPCILAGCPPEGTVLDPFGGAGTTGLVAKQHGRNAVLLELNPEYAAMARERIDNPPAAKRKRPANDNAPDLFAIA